MLVLNVLALSVLTLIISAVNVLVLIELILILLENLAIPFVLVTKILLGGTGFPFC